MRPFAFLVILFSLTSCTKKSTSPSLPASLCTGIPRPADAGAVLDRLTANAWAATEDCYDSNRMKPTTCGVRVELRKDGTYSVEYDRLYPSSTGNWSFGLDASAPAAGAESGFLCIEASPPSNPSAATSILITRFDLRDDKLAGFHIPDVRALADSFATLSVADPLTNDGDAKLSVRAPDSWRALVGTAWTSTGQPPTAIQTLSFDALANWQTSSPACQNSGTLDYFVDGSASPDAAQALRGAPCGTIDSIRIDPDLAHVHVGDSNGSVTLVPQ